MSSTGETSDGSTLDGSTSPSSPVSNSTLSGSSFINSNPFAVFNQPSALQHQSTHLNYTASPSLTGELLRQALSEFLRTQICDVMQVVCLYGFNNHDLNPADGIIPIQMGKLCYAVITQSELILIDRKCIGMMVFCVPFHVIREIRIDSDREDYFHLELRPDRGPGFPSCFVLSSVHRKNLCEALTCMYNAHFLFAAMMPDPGAALSASAQAALLAHAQVAASPQIYSTQGRDTDASAQDPLLKSGVLSLHRLIPQNQFSVLTTSSNHTSTIGRIRKLKVVFEDTRSPFKHPAEQFYAALPSKYRGHIFHRCGYMFETKRYAASAVRVAAANPQQSSSNANGADANGTPNVQPLEEEVGEWVDQAALFLNRPTATYRFQSPSDIEKNIPLPRRKYLMVSFCPERAISSFSNVVKSRDLRGHVVGRAQGKATLRELLKGRDDCDDDDFFMWAESVGRSIAMNECRSAGNNEYFVPQSLVHTKKCNVVGDKASWMCFKIHIYTLEREIGVIACRRKCLPPYFDTFQDVVFVLYGACAPINQPLQPRPGFMGELEMMVDTLSPSVVPLPFHYGRGLDLKVIHPTYADILVSQGRVNALLNNSMAYDWLATRAWVQSARGEHGIFPTTEFLGSPCFRLAKSFANSILVRVTHRRERVVWAEYLPVAIEGIGMESADNDGAGVEGGAGGGSKSSADGGGAGGGEEQKYNGGEGGEKKEGSGGGGAEGGDDDEPTAPKQPLVADPMVIVSRMLTEFAAVEAVNRKKMGPQTSTYSAEEEWRCRVSQYLAYCVDDGIFPGALNIKRLLSVLTRAFLDAPILSAETSMKLDRVVDFLLYLKRRCGSVVELPSAKHAAASVAASRGKTKHHGKRNLKQATAETVGSTSPFASLAAESPSASFTEGDPSAYDYDEQSTLLQKLRDPTLLENFTCNEHIMIPLLDTSYIESLEKATIGTAMQQEGSVIPALLASLLTKDYNIDLIRAVRDKIISYEIHHEILIPPLIALMKDGTMQTSQYALHALTMLARFHPKAVVDAGGATLPVWFVFMSKNELLLSASIDLILILFSDETRHLFAQPLFAMKLVDLLRKRVGGARYQNVVLQKTASLMFKLAKIPELLHIFLSTYAHRELVAIIGEHEKKHPILLEITVCLAQLFVFAKNKMLGTPSENAKEDASIIVSTMAYYTTRSQLRICLNMLVALQILIRLPKAYYARLSNTMNNRNGGVQFTAPDKSFESRIVVLQHLHTRVGLENVLDRAYASADAEVRRCEELLKQTGAISVNANGEKVVSPPEGDTSDPLSAAARELETIEQRKIAINVKRNARWFKTRMNYAVSANWNVNIIWQKDNSKNFLAGFKD